MGWNLSGGRRSFDCDCGAWDELTEDVGRLVRNWLESPSLALAVLTLGSRRGLKEPTNPV